MLLHSLLVATLAVTVSADCYSHDGIKALDSKYYTGPEMVSCGNGTSNCCLQEEKCGTNLLCVNGAGGVTRQYCADAAWNGCSDICPDYREAGVALRDCGNNIYCCEVGTEEACCTDDRAFYVDPDNGSVTQTTIAAKTKEARWFTVDTSSILASNFATSTSSSKSTSQTPASSSATTTTASSASSISSISSTSSMSSTSSAAPTSTETGKSSSGISGGAGAGIGIGAAAGVALVGALVWFLLRKRQQKARLGAASEVSGATNPALNNEKIGPPQSYYAHNSAPPTEMDALYRATQELDGGVPNMTRHELALPSH